MMRVISRPVVRAAVTVLCIAAVPYATMAQSFPQAQQPQLLTLDQLDRLVAPIALYPDPLLSQVLAASTYPLEIVEAQQWLQQNRNLSSQQLVEAAKQQNWDPSVQLLVAFPEVMALVTRDIRWTTDLGNAFLAQQADVMNAIQQLRSEASNNGRLRSTPQQIVSTETQNDESAIQIQPANPQVIYPPVYNPAYVWGPQVAGDYPAVSDPRALSYGPGDYGSQGDYGSGFGSGIDIGGLFSGLLSTAGTIGSGLVGSGFGFGAWGWVLNWFTHSLFTNGSFFDGLGFRGYGNYGGGGYGYRSAGFGGGGVWAHNPAHRLGVPYSNGFVSARYRGGDFGGRVGNWRSGGANSWRSGFANSGRSSFDGWHRPGFAANNRSSYENYPGYARADVMPQRSGSNFRGSAPFDRAPQRSESNFRGSAAFDRVPQRSESSFRGSAAFERAPQRPASEHFNFRNSPSTERFYAPRGSGSHFSAPQKFSAPHFSAPHFSAPRGSSHSSGHMGGGHSGGGHSGGRSGKGSHRH